MNDPSPTLLDRLDRAPVTPAPLGELLIAGRVAKRRRRRAVIGGAAAATLLVLGGSAAIQTLTTGEHPISPADDAAAAVTFPVRVTDDLPSFAAVPVGEPLSNGVQAAWDPDAHTLTYVFLETSICGTTAAATITDGTVSLMLTPVSASPGLACTADAPRLAAIVENIDTTPTALTVTDDGVTREVPFVTTPYATGLPVSPDDLAKAEAVAREVIADEGATVTNASVLARTGTTGASNTGHPCTSGRELQIRLIGTFPNTVTSGLAVEPGTSVQDFAIRAMNITVDADTGLACLIDVQTGEDGAVQPIPGSTTLSIG